MNRNSLNLLSFTSAEIRVSPVKLYSVGEGGQGSFGALLPEMHSPAAAGAALLPGVTSEIKYLITSVTDPGPVNSL